MLCCLVLDLRTLRSVTYTLNFGLHQEYGCHIVSTYTSVTEKTICYHLFFSLCTWCSSNYQSQWGNNTLSQEMKNNRELKLINVNFLLLTDSWYLKKKRRKEVKKNLRSCRILSVFLFSKDDSSFLSDNSIFRILIIESARSCMRRTDSQNIFPMEDFEKNPSE